MKIMENGGATDRSAYPTKSLLDMSENGELLTDNKNNSEETVTENGPPAPPTSQAEVVADVPANGTTSSPNKSVKKKHRKHESKDPKGKKDGPDNDDGSSSSSLSTILAELQEKLHSEMALKAEAENKLRLAQRQISDLHNHGREQTAEFEKYRGLEQTLKEVILAKEDAEHSLTMALQRIDELTKERSNQEEHIEKIQFDLISRKEAMATQEQELQKIREQRDEQERKEMALTNRLNAAKKKEAEKIKEAGQYEEELRSATARLQTTTQQVEELTKTKERLQKELEETIISSRQRQVQTEAALADERKLNEDRKQKMKVFIEKKSEELQQAKQDNEALQTELNQTSRSLSELNMRWKQLHAQWVQSQTRNRELQRDLHRIKKDSETLHKVGDSLEMKLSKSATETEEHKNKRLAAKHELMTVLKTLEAEREVAARLRDSIKFTFTPKALSQQQLLNETVEDFETQLVKLAIRLRRPLPSTTSMDNGSNHDESSHDDGWVDSLDEQDNPADGVASSHNSRATLDTQRLIEKLNRETQQVSKCIMTLVGGIERLHLLLDSSGDRTCYSVLTDLISSNVAGSTGHVPVATSDPNGSQQQRLTNGTSASRNHLV